MTYEVTSDRLSFAERGDKITEVPEGVSLFVLLHAGHLAVAEEPGEDE